MLQWEIVKDPVSSLWAQAKIEEYHFIVRRLWLGMGTGVFRAFLLCDGKEYPVSEPSLEAFAYAQYAVEKFLAERGVPTTTLLEKATALVEAAFANQTRSNIF